MQLTVDRATLKKAAYIAIAVMVAVAIACGVWAFVYKRRKRKEEDPPKKEIPQVVISSGSSGSSSTAPCPSHSIPQQAGEDNSYKKYFESQPEHIPEGEILWPSSGDDDLIRHKSFHKDIKEHFTDKSNSVINDLDKRRIMNVKGDGACGFYSLFANLYFYLDQVKKGKGTKAMKTLSTLFYQRDRCASVNHPNGPPISSTNDYIFTAKEYNSNLDLVRTVIESSSCINDITSVDCKEAIILHLKYLAIYACATRRYPGDDITGYEVLGQHLVPNVDEPKNPSEVIEVLRYIIKTPTYYATMYFLLAIAHELDIALIAFNYKDVNNKIFEFMSYSSFLKYGKVPPDGVFMCIALSVRGEHFYPIAIYS